jgi:CheY-like chemotaxis protein
MAIIIVAENESVIRLNMANVLEDCGHEVIPVDSTEEALRQLTQRPDVSVLVASIELRGQSNGLALVHEAKRLRPDIRIIVATGRSREEIGSLPFHAVYLAKPYAQREIEAAVMEAVA